MIAPRRVAIYRVLYGEDYIKESIESILPAVDRVVVALAPRPWGASAGVFWRGEWVPWPAKFDGTREVVEGMGLSEVEVVDDFYPRPRNQHRHLVNDVVLPRYPHTDEVVFIEPDHVFRDDQLGEAVGEWSVMAHIRQATTRMVELWKTPAWRIAERHRPSVLFHRIGRRPIGPTSGDGGVEGQSSHWLRAQVHNLGFCFSESTMAWKHLTALSFSDEIGDAPPDPEWLERWRTWKPGDRNLEISLGGQHTIPEAFPYDVRELPDSIRRRLCE